MNQQLKSQIADAKEAIENARGAIESATLESFKDSTADNQLAGMILQDLLKQINTINEKATMLKIATEAP